MNRVEALIEAMPYISKFSDKIVVIKYGGAAMANEAMQRSVMADIAMLKQCGIKPIIVHGGGRAITNNLELFGVESEFVDGLRRTDEAAMGVVQMTLAGKIAVDLVKLIGEAGARAIGISGVDSECIKAEPLGEEYGQVGKVAAIDTEMISMLIDNDYVPVISPIGVHGGQVYNINADTVALGIASSLKAEKLVFLSDVEGVLDKDGGRISELKLSDVPVLVRDGVIEGAMIPKIQACVEAMRKGVKSVHIINGMTPHSLIIEMLTNDGIGTVIRRWEIC